MNAIQKKIILICMGMLCIFCIVISRLIYLQIHLNRAFSVQSTKNYTRYEKKMAPRGDILDRNGYQLATNRPQVNIYWKGSGKRNLSDEQRAIIEHIATFLNKESLDLEKITTAERRFNKQLLAEDITIEQLSAIEELYPNHANILIETTFKRFYPFGSCACHILGYLGKLNLEQIGKMGLEMILEDQLKGEYGTTIKTINSFGRSLAETEVKRNLTGETIQTTLDLQLQLLAESVFPSELSGACIIMDPSNGAIRALVSRPSFDPTLFLDPILKDEWDELQEQRPFLNRAFNACYPPGSIFKLVTACAALETHLIHSADSFHCRGFVNFRERAYFCHYKQGHGCLSAVESVAHSCNTLFFHVGAKIDIDVLAQYANIFGLGKKTGIIFHEKEGLIPNRQWKKNVKGERWWQGETLSASIGQSFLLVTPIQAIRMISSIFTGYLVKPRILETEPVECTPLKIRNDSRNFLQQSMKMAVNIGTCRQVNIKDIDIYAKTSTAQTSDLSKRLMGKEFQEHGLFVGYFKYKNHKPLTIFFILEHSSTSRAATSVAREFLIAYKKLMENEPETDVIKDN